MLNGGHKQTTTDDSSFSRNSNSTNSAPVSCDSVGHSGAGQAKAQNRTTSEKNHGTSTNQDKQANKPET